MQWGLPAVLMAGGAVLAAGALLVMSPEPTCSNQVLLPGQICQVTRKGTPLKLDYEQMAAENNARRLGTAGVGAAVFLAGGGVLMARTVRRPGSGSTAAEVSEPPRTDPPGAAALPDSLRTARNAVSLDVTVAPPPARPGAPVPPATARPAPSRPTPAPAAPGRPAPGRPAMGPSAPVRPGAPVRQVMSPAPVPPASARPTPAPAAPVGSGPRPAGRGSVPPAPRPGPGAPPPAVRRAPVPPPAQPPPVTTTGFTRPQFALPAPNRGPGRHSPGGPDPAGQDLTSVRPTPAPGRPAQPNPGYRPPGR